MGGGGLDLAKFIAATGSAAALLVLAPLLLIVYMIVLLALPGDPAANRYCDPPPTEAADAAAIN
jgi:uncharacterized membrane protein YhaH (DUF805 family)